MQQVPLELGCDVCGVLLQAEPETQLVELGTRHGFSIHEHAPSSEHLLAQVRQQNW